VTRILYVGHGTVQVALDGVRLLTDPLLRNRVTHLRRAVPVDAGALRGIDAVLVSHIHYDHLDVPSLERLGKETPIILPRGAARLLRKRGFSHLIEIDVGEEIDVGNVRVRATFADHDSGRLPLGVKAPALGYLLEGSHTVYFAGDTDIFAGMSELAPSLDVALVPIWGWGPDLGPGHLDPERAAESLTLLRPRIAVPIHWGTYHPIGLRRTVPDYLRRPPDEFRRLAAERAPEVEVRVLQPGQSLELG
jgi:L-ascorbate metabolism protein UlaG (beta-lactamase superfamily)